MKMKALTLSLMLVSLGSVAGTPNFSGYGRYAQEASGDEMIYLKGDYGEINAAGRLGNEGNWMEWMLTQDFEMDQSKFNLNVMIGTPGHDDWGKLFYLQQFYGGGSGIFPSQPDAYVWAGKRFYGREQGGLSDYYMLSADGSGAGVDNLNVGFGKLDLGWTQAGDGAGAANTTQGTVNMLMLHLHDMKIGKQGTLKFRANYAFALADIKDNLENDTAMQLFAAYRHTFGDNWVQLAGRYETDGAAFTTANSSGTSWAGYEDKTARSYGAFVDGAITLGEMTAMEYNANYLKVDCTETGCSFDEKEEYGVAVRPQHHWNDYMATAVEAGFHNTKEDSNQSDAWKLTLSQNFQIGHFMWSRPVVRFYVVTGEKKNTGKNAGTTDLTKVGAMVEAWW
ncbi:carbohydrate porin [Agarivorans sp. Z349TD_8]|uniref:carbohydrate porin n=1 Tax=Agarivorans sp. Z349TD_8 TaxID=3421434 RepID=UPI003D7CCFB4